ncbi:MAG: hypothetical protein ACOC3Z_00325 [Nanoarchaeota archaeon]
MKFKKVKNPYLRIIFGLLFIIIGVIGLFVPILQGIFFIIIGLIILFGKNFIKKLLRKQ